MKYYLHDSNSFQDEKIGMLFDRFGYEGLGLFYTILEKLAYQEKPVNTQVLKRQLHVGRRLEKCWLFMESLEIISSNNGETFNENLLKFSEKFTVKSEKNRKRISEWRANKGVTKNVTRTESVCNTPKDNISKYKIRKGNILLEKESKETRWFYKLNHCPFLFKNKKASRTGAAKKEKVQPHFFEESPYFEQAKFLEYFSLKQYPRREFPDTDIEYYYNRLKQWAEYGTAKNPGRKESKDWLCNARTFMQKDQDEGKLKMKPLHLTITRNENINTDDLKKRYAGW